MPDIFDKENYLIKQGWDTWYNDNYWVHPDLVEDPNVQDYTHYGVSLEDAIKIEKLGRPKHKSLGSSEISKIHYAITNF